MQNKFEANTYDKFYIVNSIWIYGYNFNSKFLTEKKNKRKSFYLEEAHML